MKCSLFKIFLEVNNITNRPNYTSLENFSEICEIVFKEIGAMKTAYFKLIGKT